MKKKFTVLLVIILNINYFCYAQIQEANSSRVDSLQVAYFNEKLELTPDESITFWPVYNEYKNEIKNARKEDEGDAIALDERVLNIRKKYKNGFKQILGTDERVNKVYVLEKDFREILRKELLERQAKDPAS